MDIVVWLRSLGLEKYEADAIRFLGARESTLSMWSALIAVWKKVLSAS
jgi:hypothetical protein